MAYINPLIDFTAPNTRQDLYDMWNGALTQVGPSDLVENLLTILAGSDFSDAPDSPHPGQLFWHRSENIMFVWHDVIENTGVSLWLAMGPDKFETAMLADEVIAAAAPVDISYDRRCVRANAARNRPAGFNQSGIHTPIGVNDGPVYGGVTAVTDEWIRVAVDGLVYAKQDFPGSAASSPDYQMISANQIVAIDQEPGREGSLIQAGYINTTGALKFNPVGISIMRVELPDGSGPVSEPTNIFKFHFAPREYSAYRSEL